MNYFTIFIYTSLSLIIYVIFSINNNYIYCNNIAHGCGSIDSVPLTNSLEAFHNSYNHGNKNIEIDLLVTEDYHIVGGHDWKRFIKFTNYDGDGLPNYTYIKTSKILKKYNVIYDNIINDLFRKYKNVKIYTDKINNYTLLKKYIKNFNRLYVEVFNYQQYYNAKSMGFKNIMLNVKDIKELKNLIYYNNMSVSIITIGAKIFHSYKRILQKLFTKKIKIYAYDIGNTTVIKKSYCKFVNGFYIDYINN